MLKPYAEIKDCIAAFQNKYKDLPTKEILDNATNDKSFRNSKLDQYNDSLISKYGDKYLTANEVDSVAKLNNIPNIFDLDKQVKSSDYNGAGEMNNTMGSKENTLNKYGYRMMLNRSYPKGQSPYKAMGGFIVPGDAGILRLYVSNNALEIQWRLLPKRLQYDPFRFLQSCIHFLSSTLVMLQISRDRLFSGLR